MTGGCASDFFLFFFSPSSRFFISSAPSLPVRWERKPDRGSFRPLSIVLRHSRRRRREEGGRATWRGTGRTGVRREPFELDNPIKAHMSAMRLSGQRDRCANVARWVMGKTGRTGHWSRTELMRLPLISRGAWRSVTGALGVFRYSGEHNVHSASSPSAIPRN